ncbi:PREDICTED: uncharacterized protein LOC104610025 [Nelumbo nucifera]|uniref:Uncharacterized protein LOC104610025 n=2 Tax=Nelumbo nucifera TaxID=4432 RepID=A0A1U8B5Q1_NELNU|nr:PREDICTED: uncharacterized protein LOC104610025 [Nelumbo nucifera]DAD33881.1 TPA_asm: hypothetical protein HUJ06_012732 [Nelumbo nucifera]
MAAQAIEKYRENAEIYNGKALCKEKSRQLLEEIALPKGLLPLEDMEEVGYNREAGFVWLKQKKSTQHSFKRIGKNVSYGTDVTAFVENRRMKKLTGVKSKELLIWVTIAEIYIDDPASDKITFKTPAGISRSFPISAFELEEEEEKKKEESGKN